MRQSKAEHAEQQARYRSRVERQRRSIGQLVARERAKYEADEEACGNPADSAENPDQRELLFLIIDVVKGE